jgi:hypothetical protein
LSRAKTRKPLPRLLLQLQNRNRFNVQNSDKKTHDLILVPLVEMLYNQKVSNVNNNLPPYAITNMYNTYKPLYPWLTKDMLKGRLKRLKKANSPTSHKPNDSQSAKAVASATTDSQVNIHESTSNSTTNMPTHDPKGTPKPAKTTPSETNDTHSTTTLSTPSSPTNNPPHFPNNTPTSAEAISPSTNHTNNTISTTTSETNDNHSTTTPTTPSSPTTNPPHCPNNTPTSAQALSPSTNHTNNTISTTTLPSSNNNPSSNPTDTPNSTVATLTSTVATLIPSRSRPVGTTLGNISLINKCIISAQAEITHLYHQELIKARELGKPCVSKGTYKKIHDNIKIERNLPENFEFPYNNIKKDCNE